MKREIRAARLKAEVEALVRGKKSPFPPALKRKLIEFTRARRADGESCRVIGDEVGVVHRTLGLWAASAGEARPPRAMVKPAGFRRIEVREMPAITRPVVVHTSGARVEGLDIAGVADLLRRLA